VKLAEPTSFQPTPAIGPAVHGDCSAYDKRIGQLEALLLQNAIAVPNEREKFVRSFEWITERCIHLMARLQKIEKDLEDIDTEGHNQITEALERENVTSRVKQNIRRLELQQEMDAKSGEMKSDRHLLGNELRDLQLEALQKMERAKALTLDELFRDLEDFLMSSPDLLKQIRGLNPCLPMMLQRSQKRSFTPVLKHALFAFISKPPFNFLEKHPWMSDEGFHIALDEGFEGKLGYMKGITNGLGMPSLTEVKSKAYDRLVSVKTQIFNETRGWTRAFNFGHKCNGETE